MRVVDVGGARLADAIERAGEDGDVIVLDESVDRLEELRRASRASNVAYLIGSGELAPLPGACVDVVFARPPISDAAPAELERVLRADGEPSIVP